MILRKLIIEGFGVFHNYQAELEPAGLTIIEGPNEAGKSTLLAFVKAMLFGFRRGSRSPRFEPLNGGLHLGRLIVDTPDGEATVERNFKENKLRVHLKDGSQVEEKRLQTWLGNTDEELFGAVYAFSLTELVSKNLDQDKVRAAISGAGTQGAGASAVEVIEELNSRCSKLLSSQGRGEIKQLKADQDNIARKLNDAQLKVSKIGECKERERTAHLEVLRLNNEVEKLEVDLKALESLEHARPQINELNKATAELAALPKPDVGLAGQAGAHSELAQKRTQYMEWVEGNKTSTAAYDLKDKQLAGILAGLGTDWTRARVCDLKLKTGLDAEIDECGQQLQGCEYSEKQAITLEKSAVEQLERDRENREYRQREVARTIAPVDTALPPFPNAVQRAEQLAVLLGELKHERQQLEFETRTQEQAAIVGQASGTVAIPAWVEYLVLVLAALGIGGAIFYAFVLSGFIEAALCALGSILCLIIWGLARRSRTKQVVFVADLVLEEQSLKARQHKVGLIENQASQIAALFGWNPLPAQESVLDSIRAWREVASQQTSRLNAEREFEIARTQEEQSRAKFEESKVGLSQAKKDLADKRLLLKQKLADAGLGDTLTLLEARSQINKVRDAQGLSQSMADEGDRRQHFSERIERHEDDLRNWLKTNISPSDDTGDALLRRFDNAGGTVSEAVTAVEYFKALTLRCEKLAGEKDLILGVQAADPIRRQLDAGVAVADILAPLHELQSKKGELNELRDESLREEATAKDNAEQLEGSHDVADLAMQREQLNAQRDKFRQKWLVQQLARVIVEKTQERHERDRSPGVLERAGALFKRVTSGKYLSVEKNEEQMQVVDEFGRRRLPEQLSRGSAELLYLCMRFGLLDQETFAPLPVVMDDVFVNLDVERAKGAALALVEFAAERQVVYFTCHPHTVDLLHLHAPNARLIRLTRDRGLGVAVAPPVTDQAERGVEGSPQTREAQAAQVWAVIQAARAPVSKQDILRQVTVTEGQFRAAIQLLINRGSVAFDGEKRGRRYRACAQAQ